MKKYIEIFKYSLKQNMTFKVNYMFSIISLAIHLFVFNELWDYILQGKTAAGFTKTQLIWYITITEFITYSSVRSYRKVSDMVKNGDIANILIKPIDFIKYQFMEDISVIIKTLINVVSIIVIGLVLTGPIECGIQSIMFTIIASMVGVVIQVLVQIFIGLMAFIMEETKGIWLVIQKLSFLLVFTPIEFYPEIVQKIFYCLPTTYMVYTPARIFIGADIYTTFILLGLEILSLIFWYVGCRMLYLKGVKRINVNGG